MAGELCWKILPDNIAAVMMAQDNLTVGYPDFSKLAAQHAFKNSVSKCYIDNKLAKLRRHASRVQFAKIHFG